MADITRGDVLTMYIALESRGPSESEYSKYLNATNISTPTDLLAAYRASSVSKFPEWSVDTYGAQGCPLDTANGKPDGTHAWHMAVIERIYNNAYNATIFGRELSYSTKASALAVTALGITGTSPKITGADVTGHITDGVEASYTSTHYKEILGDNPVHDGKYTLMNIGKLPVTTSTVSGKVAISNLTSGVTSLPEHALEFNGTHLVPYIYDNWGGKYWAERLTNGDENDLNGIIGKIISTGYTDDLTSANDGLFGQKMQANSDTASAKESFVITNESSAASTPYIGIVPNSDYVNDTITPNEQQYIPIAVNSNAVSTVSSEASVVRLVTDEDTKALALNVTMPAPMDYQKEYGLMYGNIVNVQMKAMRTQLSDLFELIDSGDTEQIPTGYDQDGNPIVATTDTNDNSGQLTIREKLSLKKDAYMNILAQVNNNANSSTLAVLDKTKKFKYELDTAASQSHKLASEVKLTDSKRSVMEQQVVDNRRIKAMASLGDTYGTMMAGGLIPTSVMWAEYFRLGKELTLNGATNEKLMQYRGAWKPAADLVGTTVQYTTEPKYFTEGAYHSTNNYKDGAVNVGNYWIVDLSDWDLTAPLPEVYLGRVKILGSGTHNADGTLNPDGDYVTDPDSTELQTLKDASDVLMATTNKGEQVPAGLIGSIKPTAKVDIANSLCSISLDGINYWRSGDIVYIDEIKTGDKTITNAYRRVAGFSNGTTVTVAPDAVLNDDTGIF